MPTLISANCCNYNYLQNGNIFLQFHGEFSLLSRCHALCCSHIELKKSTPSENFDKMNYEAHL